MISFINTMPTYFEKDFVDLNQPSSARIEADLARIELRQRESSRVGANPREKKKKHRRGIDARATTSDAGAAPSQPRLCFLD